MPYSENFEWTYMGYSYRNTVSLFLWRLVEKILKPFIYCIIESNIFIKLVCCIEWIIDHFILKTKLKNSFFYKVWGLCIIHAFLIYCQLCRIQLFLTKILYSNLYMILQCSHGVINWQSTIWNTLAWIILKLENGKH